jgi:hypothetical protein
MFIAGGRRTINGINRRQIPATLPSKQPEHELLFASFYLGFSKGSFHCKLITFFFFFWGKLITGFNWSKKSISCIWYQFATHMIAQ